MNFGAMIAKARKATADNTPMILTVVGATGLVTTAILTGQATFKAAEVLRIEQEKLDLEDEPVELTPKQKVELTWLLYVPAVGTGITTFACIIAANRIHTRRAAALASAYSLSQEAFREYKDKVVTKLGEKKEQAVRDEIAQDRVNKNPPAEIIVFGGGEALCLDKHSGRYFNSTLEGLKKAQNDINYRIIHDSYASLSDFWDLIGLPKTAESDEIGWNTDTGLEIEYSTAMTPDGRPCITINFQTTPGRGYFSVYS